MLNDRLMAIPASTDFMSMFEKAYAQLGLPQGASLVAIDEAYKKLARQLHPDSQTNTSQNANHFAEIVEAYQFLKQFKAKEHDIQRFSCLHTSIDFIAPDTRAEVRNQMLNLFKNNRSLSFGDAIKKSGLMDANSQIHLCVDRDPSTELLNQAFKEVINVYETKRDDISDLTESTAYQTVQNYLCLHHEAKKSVISWVPRFSHLKDASIFMLAISYQNAKFSVEEMMNTFSEIEDDDHAFQFSCGIEQLTEKNLATLEHIDALYRVKTFAQQLSNAIIGLSSVNLISPNNIEKLVAMENNALGVGRGLELLGKIRKHHIEDKLYREYLFTHHLEEIYHYKIDKYSDAIKQLEIQIGNLPKEHPLFNETASLEARALAAMTVINAPNLIVTPSHLQNPYNKDFIESLINLTINNSTLENRLVSQDIFERLCEMGSVAGDICHCIAEIVSFQRHADEALHLDDYIDRIFLNSDFLVSEQSEDDPWNNHKVPLSHFLFALHCKNICGTQALEAVFTIIHLIPFIHYSNNDIASFADVIILLSEFTNSIHASELKSTQQFTSMLHQENSNGISLRKALAHLHMNQIIKLAIALDKHQLPISENLEKISSLDQSSLAKLISDFSDIQLPPQTKKISGKLFEYISDKSNNDLDLNPYQEAFNNLLLNKTLILRNYSN